METSTASNTIKAQGATPAPTPSAPRPLLLRLRLWLHLWAFKLFVRGSLGLLRYLRIGGMGTLQPTFRKRYPVGARLQNEVWIPSSWKAGQKLPLYIDVHGGGFALGDPFHDSEWCSYLAEKQGVCVVSCDYRKAPGYYFPTQTKDLVEIVTSILNDTTLPIDTSKVCMGGFSAGGNLTLSVAQHPSLRDKFAGLLLWYPVTDFSSRYKGKMQKASDGSPDVLEKTSELFNYGYVAEGTNREDPLLSPVYADRKLLPKKMLFIGAEHDVLCAEAEKTAEFYAEIEDGEVVKGDTAEDEKKGVQRWSKGGIWWTKVLDAQHGFNYLKKKDPVAEEQRKKITDKVYAMAATWLQNEIYA